MAGTLTSIGDWLDEQGFEKGCYGICRHSDGLPSGIRVKPDHSPIDGAYVLQVTATEVLQATCRYPSLHNDWRIIKRIPYKSKNELKQTLNTLVASPKGCW